MQPAFGWEMFSRSLQLDDVCCLALSAAARSSVLFSLLLPCPPNQPHRCEIAKMIVHPNARRLGIGRSLMNRAIARAGELGKTLVTLDTRTGDLAEPLYASVGFEVAGVIPGFAWDPDGRTQHATTYMFRRIAQ
jgi:ribosomal protein S18 acetylase RimI-like enzyme